MHAGAREESPLRAVKGQLFLGEESFINKVKRLIIGKETLKKIPRVQRYVPRPSLEEFFKNKHRDKISKSKAIYMTLISGMAIL